uniref:Uncharacterized protein n=1 Tax=Macrostomum lignano TaxID=282301 RepID=A0A1I8IB12_9PLAT
MSNKPVEYLLLPLCTY